MISLPRSVTAVLAAVPLVVLALGACSEPEVDGGAAPAPTNAPARTVTTEPEGQRVAQPATGEPACEDFGSLSGTSLAAVSTGTTAAAAMSVGGRPVTTKLAVAAFGSASSIVGQPVALGAGANTNHATCTHCVTLAIGCSATSCAGAAWFFARAGTATFTKVGYTEGAAFEGTVSDVILEQVNIDFDTMTSTPLGTGACVRIPSLTFSARVGGEVDAPPPSDAGTSDGGSTTTREDGGSKSTGGGGGGGGTRAVLI